MAPTTEPAGAERVRALCALISELDLEARRVDGDRSGWRLVRWTRRAAVGARLEFAVQRTMYLTIKITRRDPEARALFAAVRAAPIGTPEFEAAAVAWEARIGLGELQAQLEAGRRAAAGRGVRLHRDDAAPLAAHPLLS